MGQSHTWALPCSAQGLSFWKTCLDFLRAARGFNRKQELPGLLKGSPKPGISLPPHVIVLGVQASPELGEGRTRLVHSVENWHERTESKVTEGSPVNTHRLSDLRWARASPLHTSYKAIDMVYVFPRCDTALGSGREREPWCALD